MRKSDSLPVTAAQIRNIFVHNFFKSAFPAQNRNFFVRILSLNLGNIAQIIVNNHFAVQGRAFRHVTDFFLAFDGVFFNIFAVNLNQTGSRLQKTGNHSHRRRFSGAIWPQKSNNLSCRNRKTDFIDSLKTPKML